MLTGYMEMPNGISSVQIAPCRGPMSLPPKGPSQAIYQCPFPTDKAADIPRPCSANVMIEEQPSWLDDLLNEPESPIHRSHRRSASDPFTYLDADSRNEELWLRNSFMGAPACGYQVPQTYKRQFQGPNNRKLSFTHGPRDNSWRSVTPPKTNCLVSTNEDDEFKALGLSCSPTESDNAAFTGTEMQNQGDAASHSSENSSGGSDCSQLKPSVPPTAPKTDTKRKQHNARRSRVRKLQYISELERNVQVMQLEGAEVTAQLEFLDQQNLILGMENRALKQRLDNLSQEQLIKSLEQEILDRELARLQYLYHVQNVNHQQHRQRQRQKQNHSVHRRGRSCDIDTQIAKLSLNRPEALAPRNGFNNLPHRN